MTYEEFEKILLAEFPEVTPTQRDQFRRMEALYVDWNSKINVISRKDMDELYSHHVLHSLCIASWSRRNGSGPAAGDRVLDLGTGGGFPGIPLAILYPDVQFTLCDSIGKKIKVADAVATSLGLKNVTTVNARAESLGQKWDWVVSRAVTSLENFLPWVKGCYGKGILYLKGGDVAEETGVAMARYRLRKGSVSTWPVNAWLKDGYFTDKYVILIEK